MRQKLDKATACPGPWDAFWTFPRSKAGYSGVCTYVDSRVCVPCKAEEGITGLLLQDKQSTMKPPWTDEEKIGTYPDFTNELDMDPEVDGTPFDPRRLDMEGRAVVCDFGMFVLFNLYCPNETNETRRPYKMNFLHTLQARVDALVAAGREVIVAGDLNVMRSPLDSGEGGIKTTAEQHYEHPARRWLDDWCAPKGPMVDVVRESHPDREGMFTCWNTKIDARPSNYGTRIDYILCSPGLRPWIQGGDIQAKVFGSDHCPVYIDLHERIELNGETLVLREVLNPADRPVSTAPVYPSDVPRVAPEPPRFATKFMDEFSAKQRTLKSLWARPSPSPSVSKSASPAGDEPTEEPRDEAPQPSPLSTLGIARAAFDSLEEGSDAAPTDTACSAKRSIPADTTPQVPPKRPKPQPKEPKAKVAPTTNTKPRAGQQKLSSFFSAPVKASSATTVHATSSLPPASSLPAPSTPPPDTDQDALLAQALAQEEEEQDRQRRAKQDEAAPVWSNLFARKLPPLCTVHRQPCKDFSA